MVNKKEEHDALEKLSEKDLWCQDLDDFVNEWNFQLKEEDDYQKSILKTNRRVSRKIGAGKGYGKGKAKNDDEYNPKPPKANINKGVVKVEQKPHQRFLSMFENKKKPKPAGFGNDGTSDAEMSGMSDDDFDVLRADKPAAKETSRAPSEQPANGRAKRAAAAAPKKWIVDEDESESDDSKFLGDVGDMVKGIGGADKIDAAATNGRVSLFAMSRPGSSHGQSTSRDLPKLKSKPSRTFDLSDDADETNYEMLARSSPQKAPPAPANDLDSFLSDDDQLVPVTKKVPVKAAAKPAPKPKKAPAPKKISEPPQAKPLQLSPAAKAYAAKQNKMKLTSNAFSDDEDDEMASDSPPPKPVVKAAPKPAKSKPKPAPKRKVVSDDEDDEVVMEDADSPPPQPAARGRGRPARAAAVVAKAKAKPVYIDSDDDEMDADEQDDSAMIEDEQSEDDFDDSD
jgi:DNA topoisomerase-2